MDPLVSSEIEDFLRRLPGFEVIISNIAHIINYILSIRRELKEVLQGMTMTGKKKVKHPMEVTKEESLKVNKELAKTRRPMKDVLEEERLAEWRIQKDLEKLDKKEGFTDLPPNIPNLPNIPNISNTPNTTEGRGAWKQYFERPKRPYQSIGRGIHNDQCYIATYIEDNVNRTYDTIITDQKEIYANSLHKNGKEWTGSNDIKNKFGLNYRDDFFSDILDSCWSNESIKKFLFENYTVDIVDIFNRIITVNKKFMIYESDFIHNLVALDVLRSFFHFLFTANSRLYFHAEKGSGKTNQLMIYRALAFNPISSSDFSSASIYRIIESTSGTILIDDFDQLPEEQKNSIIQHIRANYKPFKVMRSDGGKQFQPRGYNAYSHLVFNNVFGLGNDDITLDRCIVVRLLKHKDAKDITVDYKNPIFSPVRDDLYICLLQWWKQVKDEYYKIKVDCLSAREFEVFKPLLAIAKLVSDDVYTKTLSFAETYFQQENMKELVDDWEFNLLETLYFRVSSLNDAEKEIEVSVKELTEELVDKIGIDDIKKRYALQSFIGSKLTGFQFRKTRPHNMVHYHIYKERIEQILDAKSWLGLLGVLGGVRGKTQKDLDLTSQPENPTLNDKILDTKNIIENNPDDNYLLIETKYGQSFIDKVIEQRHLNEKILGKQLVWIGD